jgi:hypothetical protein
LFAPLAHDNVTLADVVDPLDAALIAATRTSIKEMALITPHPVVASVVCHLAHNRCHNKVSWQVVHLVHEIFHGELAFLCVISSHTQYVQSMNK